MTTTKPSIAELKLLGIERTDDEIAVDGHICARCCDPFIVPSDLEPTTVCDMCAQWFVATVAPVLLEIAAAALALRKAAAAYSESGWLSDDNPLFKQVDAAHRAYDDALNKVRP
ncbi:MAG TPA: hypothetical protein VFT22_07510 [Kofleriaceae bacterium]|nr:hypothetical protein [Kofleriaceae bacterium]